MTARHEFMHEVGTDETGRAGDKTFHKRQRILLTVSRQHLRVAKKFFTVTVFTCPDLSEKIGASYAGKKQCQKKIDALETARPRYQDSIHRGTRPPRA